MPEFSAAVTLKKFFGLKTDQKSADFVKESNDFKNSDPEGYHQVAQDCAAAMGTTLK